MQAYLMIEADRPQVSVYRRKDEGGRLAAFSTERYIQLEDVVPLDEVGIELPLAELYRRTKFEQ